MRTVEYTTITGEPAVTWVPENMSDEEVERRLKSHHDFAALGHSVSPRAVARPAPAFLPELAPRESRRDWSPPKPPRQTKRAGDWYWAPKLKSQREAFAEVYGKHTGRR